MSGKGGQKKEPKCVLMGPQRAKGDQHLLRARQAECLFLIPDHLGILPGSPAMKP